MSVKRSLSTTPSPAHIRRLRKADVPACAALVAGDPLWRRYRYGAERCARDLIEALRRKDLVHVAVADGEIAGVAWVLPRGGFGRLPYLKIIAVRREDQGRGLGASLLRASQGDGHLLLLVSDFNRRARRFYAAMGFQRIGALPGLVLPGVSEVLLWGRPLTPSSRRPAARRKGARQGSRRAPARPGR